MKIGKRKLPKRGRITGFSLTVSRDTDEFQTVWFILSVIGKKGIILETFDSNLEEEAEGWFNSAWAWYRRRGQR